MHPDRVPLPGEKLALTEVQELHFERPDEARFPALTIAREAGIAGQTYPTVLSAADDEAVQAFLTGALRFVDIPSVVQAVLDRHQPSATVTLQSIAEADAWARVASGEVIARMQKA
jgi:1-deoxy-D-xylulose-5-phosphate reductoisomerase